MRSERGRKRDVGRQSRGAAVAVSRPRRTAIWQASTLLAQAVTMSKKHLSKRHLAQNMPALKVQVIDYLTQS